MKPSYPTKTEAEADLLAAGFKLTTDGEFWAKPSMSGGNLMQAPAPMLALCKVIENVVDPKWEQPNYFEIRFC